jgi:bifunctional non-homologous end joining protein LigD
VSRLAFIRPLSPSAAVRPPKGEDRIHEPKWDGFRFQVIKGSAIRLYSAMALNTRIACLAWVEAFGKLPTQSAILDGELVLIDPRGAPPVDHQQRSHSSGYLRTIR